MNFVYLSPHFPPNFYMFCVRLRELGVTVLGLADTPYESLRPELRGALTEYFKVDDLHNFDQLIRACGYFIHRYGRLDRVESHNEYWLETEARLRTDFNIPGVKTDTIANITLKSRMKELFRESGVEVARGEVVPTLEAAKALIREIGYPVVLKPDRGVGATATYRIEDEKALTDFFAHKPDVDYIMEEFITGTIISFDGLSNRDGEVVFYTSHLFGQGIMETVNENLDILYYSLRNIPNDLCHAGHRVVKTFGVTEKFFHVEFFRTPEGRLIGLEFNCRPPGGLTMDMFNFANDIDLYTQYAKLVASNSFDATYCRPYHCGYIGRKSELHYRHDHEEIMRTYGQLIVHYEPINSIFRGAIGDFGYLVRSADLARIEDAARFIQEKQ
ncbi:MAG: ATP-grasp domain-containing protein [Deltaproteobacteria bacterium]|nr:ATP-grasp domain-containing protein [Deltaproteobacteria bacterium]